MKRVLGGPLLALLVLAPGIRAQNAPEVRKIEFSGVRTFEKALLRSAIVTNKTTCSLIVFLCDHQYVDEVGLRGDLVRLRLFYYQRGYRDTKVQLDTIRQGNGLDIHFTIAEGQPVRVASIDVNSTDASETSLPLAVGQPFSLLDYETTRDTLRARLVNLGFARAEVLANYTIPRDSPYVAHIGYDLVAGERVRFGPITVTGNQNVSTKVIRRMLTFGTGDFYSYDDELKSQRNLFGLETFSHVAISTDLNAGSDTVAPVTVQVNESKLHAVRFGGGLSTAEFLNTEGSWTSRNFLGGARRLELRGRVYNVLADPLHYINPPFEDTKRPYNDLSGLASIDFSQPWFFDPLNTLNAGLYAERRSLPSIFVRRAEGGYLTLTRTLGRATSLSFGYRPELTQLTAGGDLVFCTNFVACGADEIKVLRDPHWLSPLALSYARNRANNLFAPTAGYIVHLDGEYAAKATGSDFSYVRLTAEIANYAELARNVVLATRVRPGWARTLDEPAQSGLGLHPQKRFFGGGANSVRGFAQFRMGPKLLTANAADFLTQDSIPNHCTAATVNTGTCDVSAFLKGREDRFDVRPVGGGAVMEGNIELRVPFFWQKLTLALFTDLGQVWRQSSDFDIADVVFTPGFGFRYFSAIGPVRVDLGYNPHPAEQLELVTTKLSSDGKNTDELVSLGTVLWNDKQKWTQRFQLHFSIGQAF